MESKGEDQKASAFCTNLFVGLAQLFTITFMLVGWFWSLTWGIYMIILAGKYDNYNVPIRYLSSKNICFGNQFFTKKNQANLIQAEFGSISV